MVIQRQLSRGVSFNVNKNVSKNEIKYFAFCVYKDFIPCEDVSKWKICGNSTSKSVRLIFFNLQLRLFLHVMFFVLIDNVS